MTLAAKCPSIARSLCAVVLAISLVACQPPAGPSGAPGATSAPAPSGASPTATPTPTSEATATAVVFETVWRNPDGTNELPVSLLDRTGLVTGIEALQGDAAFEDGISDAVEGTGLIYSWSGGACDSRTLLTFERVGDRFQLLTLTETTGDMCILIAIGRRIAIHLSEPMPAGSVTVRPGQP